MSNPTYQIFQTSNPKRWTRFKWTFRFLLFILVFFIAVVILALFRGSNPSLPILESQANAYAKKLDPSAPLTFAAKENKKYKGIRDFLLNKEKNDSLQKRVNVRSVLKNPYIRAAFYTAWQQQSAAYRSLKRNGNKLNTIFPEWFFIDSVNGLLNTRIDTAGLWLMKQYKLNILPVLTNFSSSKKIFDASLVQPLFTNEQKRRSFINQLRDTLVYYKFPGINIDFEEISEKNKELLVLFLRDLRLAFEPFALSITIDVPTENSQYDYKKIADYADHVILMAYDESYLNGQPGPISGQKWVEKSLDQTARLIPPDKLILGIAGYGYDWASDHNNKVISYSEALNKAKILKATIDYDNDSYNLHYAYTEEKKDDEGKLQKVDHEVWFTDAATSFNILRFSDEYATAGTALWVLGREDERMWRYYDRDLSNDGLDEKPFDFNELQTIPVVSENVGYVGEGEVLNIISAPQEGRVRFEIDSVEQIITEQQYLQLPSGYIIEKFAEDTTVGKGHKLVLTFDDGPNKKYTTQILDILQREQVPATFFIVGLQAEKNIPLLKRIYNSGYEIGNHTFTHNNIAKMSAERAELEMKLTRLLIESITGRSTILFRAPYNADAEPQTYEELEPIARSCKDNYLTIGESIDPNDWQPGVLADSIFHRTVKQVEERNANIILLHDAGGDSRQATVDALPKIISYFKQKGYVFTTVADLMGKTRDEVMPEVPSSWMMRMNFFFAEATYWGGQFLFALFLLGIGLSVGRMLLVGILAYKQRKKENEEALTDLKPRVSIIVPAYNEEVSAVNTIRSLMKQDYPHFDIVFVDDGSKDNTFLVVSSAFAGNERVKILTKPNGGKASALNYGIEQTDAEYVICIDADTQLKENAVTELMKRFVNERIGAVAGNVKVGNEINLLTRWQSIEYVTAQNFDRRAFDLLDCITVVPGAIGAFRKQAIISAGGFTTDTLAEDCDLTMRLHKSEYIVKNCTDAIAFTEAPETLRAFLKQRFRWSFGIMQSFWKHRDALFNRTYGNLGMVALPNILVFQILLPFLAPLADLVLLFSLIAAGAGFIEGGIWQIVFYYGVFSLVDAAGAAIAFAFEKEDYRKLIWLLPQRFVYRQLIYYVLFKSLRKAIKGELQGWGKLKRTGTVKLEARVG
jgi:cellulose synthase/poly-beta-1,6-N-acetylglucosamine synthase-like glycosyltransferase/spore germination protein YaaH/peptidoglycan/xylan/chitin deacetylase (PgdA/CDA1 family)